MLKRLYIDNYKCFSNFEFKPGALNLLMGRNGTGKTSVFSALACIRDVALGRRDVLAAFPPETFTRWDTRRERSFALEVESPDGVYAYGLQLQHKDGERDPRILRESLMLAGRPLFEFADGEVHLFRNDHSSGPIFPADWRRSALATVPERRDNTKLWWFKRWLERLWVLTIDPRAMQSESRVEVSDPAADLSDFPAWYRHVLQERPGELAALFADLTAVLPGLASLNLRQVGEGTRRLTARFSTSATTTLQFGLEELSDGQRCLIALYSLLHLGLRSGALLCLDEPDNFVALAEIQPWLVALRERTETGHVQVLLISHNREVINYLARDLGVLIERDADGPARARPFEYDETLLPAETVARGWE